MRLPATPLLSTKDGISNKNARLTNTLREYRPMGDMAVLRPGLSEQTALLTDEVGRGLVVFNDKLLSVYGATFLAFMAPVPVTSFAAVEPLDAAIFEEAFPAEAYITSSSIAADELGYCSTKVAGWYIGVSYNYAFTWEESLGFQQLSPPLVAAYDWNYRGYPIVSADGNYVFFVGQYGSYAKIYEWNCETFASTNLGPDNSIGADEDLNGHTNVTTVSSTGHIVAGRFKPLSGVSYKAFRWVRGTGFQDISDSQQSRIESGSVDGSILVGSYFDGATELPAKWDSTNGWVSLGSLGGTQGRALDCSSDGTIIVGFSKDGSGASRLFIWTVGVGIVDLDVTETYTACWIHAISSDGSTVVGYINSSGNKAFRWDDENKFTLMTFIGQSHSTATGVSDNGQVIVGGYYAAGNYRGFKWSLADGVESFDVGVLAANHVSSDGLSIMGDMEQSGYTICPFIFGGVDASPHFRSIATLSGDFFDFAQSTL